jgi:hypothetical protein
MALDNLVHRFYGFAGQRVQSAGHAKLVAELDVGGGSGKSA